MTRSKHALTRVAGMVADRAGAELNLLLREISAIETRISALRRPDARPIPNLAFQCSGGDRHWQNWKLQELSRLNGELARLRVREPALREAAGRATARAELLKKMTGLDA